MNNIYISNNRIISSFYSGYQPFPRRWEMDKEGSKATLIFGPNRIELTFEIWNKIFKEIMVSEGICSEKTMKMLDIQEFDIEGDQFEHRGIRVKYLYLVKEII